MLIQSQRLAILQPAVFQSDVLIISSCQREYQPRSQERTLIIESTCLAPTPNKYENNNTSPCSDWQESQGTVEKRKVCKWFHSNFKREKFPVLKYISRSRSRFWFSLKFTAHHFQLSKQTIFFPSVITRDKTFQPVKTNQHQPPTVILKEEMLFLVNLHSLFFIVLLSIGQRRSFNVFGYEEILILLKEFIQY